MESALSSVSTLAAQDGPQIVQAGGNFGIIGGKFHFANRQGAAAEFF